MYALGHNDQAVDTMMRRVALDSMPAARLAVLRALAAQDGQTTTQIARSAELHRYVAHRHCEDMTAVGVVEDLSEHDERDHRWVLDGAEGDLIRKSRREREFLTRRVGSHPPPPSKEGAV